MTYLRFGIRDLLWAMVVVGLVIGWGDDRSRLTDEIRDYENIKMPNKRGRPATGIPLKEWRQEQKEWRETEKRLQGEWNEKTEVQRERDVRELFGL